MSGVSTAGIRVMVLEYGRVPAWLPSELPTLNGERDFLYNWILALNIFLGTPPSSVGDLTCPANHTLVTSLISDIVQPTEISELIFT